MLTSDFSWVFWAEEPHRTMKVFVSYSSHDDVAVRSLVADLERARQQVWLDQDLGGGDAWWAEILEQIRACTVFVFALSNNSLYSTPCRAELDYAKALRLPILPVQIGEVGSYRTDPIFSMQFVDYRDTTKSSIIDLVSALHERGTRRVELPDPLPEPPPIPYEYLQRLGASIHGSAELSPAAQAAMSLELRTALQYEQDNSVRDDIRALLRALRGRHDITHAIVREIDSILDKDAAGAAIPPFSDTAPVCDLAGSDARTPDRPPESTAESSSPAETPDPGQTDTDRPVPATLVDTPGGAETISASPPAPAEALSKPRTRLTRRTKMTLVAGTTVIGAVIAAAVTIPAILGHQQSQTSRHSAADGGVRPAGTDEQGFLNSDARCDPGHPAAAMGSTTQTELVLCQTGPGSFYYRGVRLSDGALIALANAVRSAGGYDVTNPADRTRYEIRPHRLTLLRTDGQVAAQETMVAYWSIPTS